MSTQRYTLSIFGALIAGLAGGGAARLMVFDHDGQTRLELGLLGDGRPRLSFLDPHVKM